MDPLTIGFEQAFHDANATAPSDVSAVAQLAAALEAVIAASCHRVHALVRVIVIDADHIELRRGAGVRRLERAHGRWRWEGSSDPSWSGVMAANLTDWLTS